MKSGKPRQDLRRNYCTRPRGVRPPRGEDCDPIHRSALLSDGVVTAAFCWHSFPAPLLKGEAECNECPGNPRTIDCADSRNRRSRDSAGALSSGIADNAAAPQEAPAFQTRNGDHRSTDPVDDQCSASIQQACRRQTSGLPPPQCIRLPGAPMAHTAASDNTVRLGMSRGERKSKVQRHIEASASVATPR